MADELFGLLLRMTESLDVMGKNAPHISVTVNVAGQIVSGKLIGIRTYLRCFKESNVKQVIDKALGRKDITTEELEQTSDRVLSSDLHEYFHLAGGEGPVKWEPVFRFRTSDLCGFSLGDSAPVA